MHLCGRSPVLRLCRRSPQMSVGSTIRFLSIANFRQRLCAPRLSLSSSRKLATTPESSDDLMPDYELQSYWDNRFKTEKHFEWLGDGVDTIIPHLRDALRYRSGSGPPRLLHIGAGSSWLSNRVLETYRDEFGQDVDAGVIVNLDFSEEVVRRGLDAQGDDRGMRWVQADVLRWDELATSLLGLLGEMGRLDDAGQAISASFALVLDKSTSDSIACAEDVLSKATDPHLNPLLNTYLATHAELTVKLPPIEVLALNLASLVRPGGIWIAMSFSATRFDFLRSARSVNDGPSSSIEPSHYWVVRDIDEVEAYSGAKDGVQAPHVHHYVYVLRRTDIS